LDVFKAILERRSIRKYVKGEKIPEEMFQKLLEAARLAPSGRNKQDWSLVIVEDPEIKQELVPACNNQNFVGNTSIVIAGIVDPSWKWCDVDLTIAFEHIVLEAVELGLGTCWIGSFEEDKVKKVLNVPSKLRVTVLLTVGFPAEKPNPRPRKPLEQLIHINKFSEK
jgi:nitroreductase